MKKYTRILSIDGGGIRGIIPGVVLGILEKKLQRISNDPNARLADYFDLIVGTSTGGILSCCYLLEGDKGRPKFTADEVVGFYFEQGETIFSRSLFHKIRSAGGVLDEKYPSKEFKKALHKYMGEARLSELLKPSLITAYDLERRKAHFFSQQEAQKKGNDFLVKDVALSTAAAPTYFECIRIKDDLNRDYALIDGGVFANNPALCGYAEARKLFKKPEINKAVTAADMMILSIGTGSDKTTYPYNKAKKWGKAEWVRPIIDIMMSGVADTVDYQLRHIYDAIEKPNNYLRVDTTLPITINHEMDDASKENMLALKEHGELVASLFDDQLQAYAEQLAACEGCELIYS